MVDTILGRSSRTSYGEKGVHKHTLTGSSKNRMTLKRPPKVADRPSNRSQRRWPKASGPPALLRRYSAGKPRKGSQMFTPTPPEESLHALSILRCTHRGHLEVRLSCQAYTGVMTHWWDDHTVLHPQHGPCEPCCGGQSPRWQGFIIVESIESGQFRLLQFTPPVARVFDSHRSDGGRLSGIVARLHREGTERNSPLFARLMSIAPQEAKFSAEQLESAVAKLFRSNFPLFDTARSKVGCLPT